MMMLDNLREKPKGETELGFKGKLLLVMDRVKIDLENCYGIEKLQHELDFTGVHKDVVALK